MLPERLTVVCAIPHPSGHTAPYRLGDWDSHGLGQGVDVQHQAVVETSRDDVHLPNKGDKSSIIFCLKTRTCPCPTVHVFPHFLLDTFERCAFLSTPTQWIYILIVLCFTGMKQVHSSFKRFPNFNIISNLLPKLCSNEVLHLTNTYLSFLSFSFSRCLLV